MRRFLRGLLIVVVAVIVVLVALALLMPNAPDYPFFDSDRPMVIAHQGGEGLRPALL